MLEQPDIPDEQLRACLRQQYGITLVALDFLPLGQDSRAGVYRAVSEHGTPYLLKAKQGEIYEASCLVPRFVNDQGITAAVAPLPSTTNALWTQVRDWAVFVYPFIEGESGWEPAMTAAQWRSVGATLHQIHHLTPPITLSRLLRVETFDPGEYAQRVRAFEARPPCADSGSVEQAVRASWAAHRHTIHTAVTALETLASALRRQAGPRVICHADLHPSNLIRDSAGCAFLIDWDDVMLAPKERDFLFIENAPVHRALAQETSVFFQGYGPAAIDWVALTYYLWERLIQDVIAYADEALCRDDLGVETRANAAQMFERALAEGGAASAALAAAAHLPAPLIPAATAPGSDAASRSYSERTL